MKISIIGCGAIAQRRHLPEIQSDPRCSLAGVFDFNADRAAEIARRFACRAFECVEQAVEQADAVYVLTTNATHAQTAIAALRAGRHVLCEKPIATTLEDAQRMVEAARNSGKFLMVGHDMRFDRTNETVRDLLRSGKMGRVITIRSSVKHGGPDNWSIDRSGATWFFKRDKAVFGALGDVGVHKLDLIRFLLDDDIARVCALTGTLQKKDDTGCGIGVEDNALCLFEMAGGVQGVMEASWCNYGGVDMSTDILCERGRVKVYIDPTHNVIVEYADGAKESIDPAPGTDSGVTRHFLDTILEGTQNVNAGESGCKSLAAIIACAQSAQTKQWVRVENERFAGNAET